MAKIRDLIVVGGGIVGATVTKYISSLGFDVLLLDDRRPGAGTPPSGGHLKPSWFGMEPEDYEPALEILDETWGLIGFKINIRPGNKTEIIHRVDSDVVVRYPSSEETVTEISNLHNYPRVTSTADSYLGRRLLVATGVWAQQLVPSIKATSKQGVSFRLRGRVSPFLEQWAPYKQIVAHQQSDNEVWIGDGTAVYPENWANRTSECLSRCVNAAGGLPLISSTLGTRPYCKGVPEGAPCLFRELGPRAWIATGAGKKGTIAAGWVAKRLAEMMIKKPRG